MRTSKIARVSPDFDEWVKGIAKDRYVKGIDKQEIKLPRMTKAITRVPNLKEILSRAKIDI